MMISDASDKAKDEMKRISSLIVDGGKIASTRTEEELHQIIHKRIGERYLHEYKLSAEDRLDFFCPETGIAIEIKIKRSGVERALFYQIERYTRSPEVLGCLIVAPFFKGMIPQIINNKPIVEFPLWRVRL